ncbi:FAD-dependent oxidoreductase [Sphingomonas koreensis]|uniref:FAD-dependent oxidoreductase n=2 Tax=Sphingomonas koreensis TaxID=93064 RepID=UPI0012FFFC7A|nr:FAD-dependent oxidoreductase [Sphingomonas koreensis]
MTIDEDWPTTSLGLRSVPAPDSTRDVPPPHCPPRCPVRRIETTASGLPPSGSDGLPAIEFAPCAGSNQLRWRSTEIATALAHSASTESARRMWDLDILIVGAGPSGLTAADHLVAAGRRPLVIERSAQTGGLIRSIRRGEFVVDLGRKELYTRIPEIDRLWNAVLGAAYRPYPHRVGSLFGGRILELSGRDRGPLRGMPPQLLCAGGIDLIRGWIDGAIRRPDSYERFWHQRVGRRFSYALAQGYWEKFRGQPWHALPVPEALAGGEQRVSHGFAAVVQSLQLAARGGVSRQHSWRHPALGTGQLTDRLAARVREGGGEIWLNAELIALERSDGGRLLATIRRKGANLTCRAEAVISSLTPEALDALMRPNAPEIVTRHKRAVMLVYLFLKAPPCFPHAWLEVNDPAFCAGRISNYAGFNGDMVPPGHSALCVEYFLNGDDPQLRSNHDQAWIARALAECSANDLIDPDRLIDAMAIRLDRCNAAASWREEQDSARTDLYDRLAAYPNLFHVHRPGADWASFAGLCAAKAILTQDRKDFDRRADPGRSYAASNAETMREEA